MLVSPRFPACVVMASSNLEVWAVRTEKHVDSDLQVQVGDSQASRTRKRPVKFELVSTRAVHKQDTRAPCPRLHCAIQRTVLPSRFHPITHTCTQSHIVPKGISYRASVRHCRHSTAQRFQDHRTSRKRVCIRAPVVTGAIVPERRCCTEVRFPSLNISDHISF
jgi:hypothetical protein